MRPPPQIPTTLNIRLHRRNQSQGPLQTHRKGQPPVDSRGCASEDNNGAALPCDELGQLLRLHSGEVAKHPAAELSLEPRDLLGKQEVGGVSLQPLLQLRQEDLHARIVLREVQAQDKVQGR